MILFFLQCSYITQPHNIELHASSLIPLSLISVVFALYIVGVLSLHQKNRKWNTRRTISFGCGCVLIAASFSPSMLDYAHHDLRGHMIQHLLLGMLAPIGLVLGAPVTLALQTLSKNVTKVISSILRSAPFHFISHPLTALLLNIGGMYVLYLTPLYNYLHNHSSLHYLIHFHFLAAGYLFTWSIVGPDPAPRRPKLFTRLVVIFISIAAHSFLSKFMFAYSYPRNSIHSKEEIGAAAKIMYYGGDFSELLLLITLFALWYNKRGKKHYELSFIVK